METTERKLMKWINVRDGFPQDGQYVIVYAKNCSLKARMYNSADITYADFCQNQNEFFDIDSDVIKDVTHWMPLPNPPKDVTNWMPLPNLTKE